MSLKAVVNDEPLKSETFPCLRLDKGTGSIFLFVSKDLLGWSVSSYEKAEHRSTEPFVGTITLTQD